jgi:cell envelope opacity-associated protein A
VEFAPSDGTEQPLPGNRPTPIEVIIEHENGTSSVAQIAVEQVSYEENEQRKTTQTDVQLIQQNCLPTAASEQLLSPANDILLHSASERVTVSMLSPLPVRKSANKPIKRRAGLDATILTASPYKQKLEEKVKNKEHKCKLKKVRVQDETEAERNATEQQKSLQTKSGKSQE